VIEECYTGRILRIETNFPFLDLDVCASLRKKDGAIDEERAIKQVAMQSTRREISIDECAAIYRESYK